MRKTRPAEPKMEFRRLTVGTLEAEQGYQRRLNRKEVRRLIREWDPRLMDPLVVNYRGGKYYLIDGQHRLAALIALFGKDFMVQCKVYIGLTYEQEAELFYKLDAAKTRLSSAQSTKARLESGVDPRVSEVHAIMTANGYTWSMDHGCGKPWHIAVTDAIVGAYDLLGAKEFDRLLRVIGAAWKGAPAALRANFLSGMALFLKTYGSDVSDDALAKRLGKVDPLEVLRCGKADTSTSQNALRYARVLWEKYNGRLGRNRLPYRFGCEG